MKNKLGIIYWLALSIAFYVYFPPAVYSMDDVGEQGNDVQLIDGKRNKLYEILLPEKEEGISLLRYHRSVSDPLHQLLDKITLLLKERISSSTETLLPKTQETNEYQLILDHTQKTPKELTTIFYQLIDLKAQTIYSLEGMKVRANSKNPLLLTPEDVFFIFREGLGIDQNILQEVDPEKLWRFVVRFVDLPTPRLPKTNTVSSREKLFTSYQELINALLVPLDSRLKEDVYSFQAFCTRDAVAQKDKLNLEKYLKEESDGFPKIKLAENLKLKMHRVENKTPNSLLAPSKLFEGILGVYGHNQEKKEQAIDEIWLTNAAGKTHQEFLQRLYGAVKCQNISSWNPEEDIRIEVKTRIKLENNAEADVSEEFITSVYKILGRHITKQVLEIIKHNFEIAISDIKRSESEIINSNDLY